MVRVKVREGRRTQQPLIVVKNFGHCRTDVECLLHYKKNHNSHREQIAKIFSYANWRVHVTCNCTGRIENEGLLNPFAALPDGYFRRRK